jgi:hypothetical protein
VVVGGDGVGGHVKLWTCQGSIESLSASGRCGEWWLVEMVLVVMSISAAVRHVRQVDLTRLPAAL